ncbi:hypothetical protein Vadar_015591 [Vaccinium darrowii]|uniref:Uncharacterized protein n=1 Tax=Vaccinium darrowii TaxID=229202 RepID=A0ACB7XA06_9ERIC|nr:hypothetical protein Vadar_015591 [Vaccinium darrowii]
METQSTPATGYPASAYPYPPPNGYPASATNATAYAYAAPPPPQGPRYYYPQQPYPDPRATFVRRLFAILIASFLIALTIALTIWLILRPRLPDFQVDSATLTNFNLSSSSSITGNWDIRFTVRNPNHKITFYYDHITAAVYYKDESLSETTVTPFVQATRNQTAVRATFAAAAAYVDKSVVDGINGDKTSRGSVNFNVRILARVRLKAGWWRARQRYLRVYCGDLAVGMSSNNTTGGTLVGGPRDCKVDL